MSLRRPFASLSSGSPASMIAPPALGVYRARKSASTCDTFCVPFQIAASSTTLSIIRDESVMMRAAAVEGVVVDLKAALAPVALDAVVEAAVAAGREDVVVDDGVRFRGAQPRVPVAVHDVVAELAREVLEGPGAVADEVVLGEHG